MERGWRIELLGELRVRRGDQVLTRFPKQLVASLLAYLACHPQHPHTRDALLEALCPHLALEGARRSLRVALHLLRRLLEPPGTAAAEPLLVVDRRRIGLNPAAFTTDVAEFEAALQAGARAASPDEQLAHLTRAVELYRGELLAGFTEEWVFTERRHRIEQYLEALHRLVSGLEQQGDLERAREYGRQAVRADPLREEAHYDLMRLYAAAGQPSATLAQYQELERLLREELNERPSAAARALAEELRRSARTIVVARRAPVRGANGPTEESSTHPLTPSLPPPAARVPALTPSPLPPQLTRFFGREEEIARVTELLGDPASTHGVGERLVTLTGPGGSGKTRLAIAMAGRLQKAFAGAVAFVPLAAVNEPARIADALADALGLTRSAEVEPLEQVVEALLAQPWLLVLDNFEQLVEEGALRVRALLERAPQLTCLVTSRQRLGLSGEQEFAVLPLPTPRSGVQGAPDKNGPAADLAGPERPNAQDHRFAGYPPKGGWMPPERLMEFPSVQLFVDRARAVRPGFEVTERNAAAVAALCDRLEGLPLALELAAARAAVLSPAQMLVQMEQRFQLLVTRQRDVPDRHRTLLAAVEGSYQALRPELQRFFTHLSVFRGGCTLAAAAAVGEAGPGQALDDLTELRECSLVVAESGSQDTGSGGEESRKDELRYRLLETLREYGWEQLRASGELAAVRDRHRDWCLQLAEQTAAAIQSPEEGASLTRLATEMDNLRAALSWCLEEAESDLAGEGVAVGLRLASALNWCFAMRWLEGMLARGSQLPAARAPTLVQAALRNRHSGEREWCLTFFEAARREYEEVGRLDRGKKDPLEFARSLVSLASAASSIGDLDATWRYCMAARRRLETMGEPHELARLLGAMARVSVSRGGWQAARACLEEQLAICRQVGHAERLIHALGAMGHVERHEGNYARAEALYHESLLLRREAGDPLAVAMALEDIAALASRQGRHERVARLLGAGEAFCETLGTRSPVADPAEYERARAEGRAALGEVEFAAAWAAGRGMSRDEATQYALQNAVGPPGRG